MTPPAGWRIRYDAPAAAMELANATTAVLRSLGVPDRRLVFLCIGTDRSTGDALGPLVGERLRESLSWEAAVLGTLEAPVHASNLHEALASLDLTTPDAVVLAVDACLGRMESVGTITAGVGALLPGAGVNKTLPEVGTAFVTGTVNVGGFMEYFVLGNTRLHLVMSMAQVIAEGLAGAARAAAQPAPAARGTRLSPALA